MESEEVDKNAANAAPKAKEHALIAADLEKVTDYAEENVISGQDMSNAIAALSGDRTKEVEKAEREKELAKVTIKKADVDLIIHEMEISRSEAERSLRENKGDPVQALLQLVN
ncbi:huntingtin-interacting protein K-like [Lytechinus pictus]|uniref:huntingtin-interacting protein K-like n=1 Tax=Lytechinus variegatus TaxID=7654 RepID=UPI001BB20457|nr:huntingtin-interacting protein K-like [Lytechinus variegatus]XP_054751037.1 huntingtin-interacting protein K-like [Lytechinus pictus]